MREEYCNDGNTVKLYSTYESLEDLFRRKDIVLDTIKNAIKRENNTNDKIKLTYDYDQIIFGEYDFKLMVVLNKEKI